MISADVQKLEKQYPEYIEKVRKNYKWNFIVIVLDASIYSFSIAMLSQDTIIPYFVSQLTSSSWAIGVVPALFYLGLYFPQLIGAYIVNGRSTWKWVIFWISVAERAGILAIALIAQFLGLFSNNVALTLLFFAYLLFSVTNGMIAPGYSDFVSKNIVKNRGLFYGVLNAIRGLVGFSAAYTAKYLLDLYSFPVNIRTLFWIGLATSLISPIIIANFREVPYPVERKSEPLLEFIKKIPFYVKKTPDFQHFMLTRAVLGLGIMANSFYALYLLEKFSLSIGSLGIFTMILLLTQSFIGVLWGWIGDRFGYKYIYVAASAMILLSSILAASSFGVWIFYVIAFCIGGTYAVFFMGDPNMIFEIAPPSETSRFIGISNTFVAPVMTLAPLIGGFLVNFFSFSYLFFAVFVISIASLLLSIWVMPNPRLKIS